MTKSNNALVILFVYKEVTVSRQIRFPRIIILATIIMTIVYDINEATCVCVSEARSFFKRMTQ